MEYFAVGHVAVQVWAPVVVSDQQPLMCFQEMAAECMPRVRKMPRSEGFRQMCADSANSNMYELIYRALRCIGCRRWRHDICCCNSRDWTLGNWHIIASMPKERTGTIDLHGVLCELQWDAVQKNGPHAVYCNDNSPSEP